ncbi:MAG: hypothetical protein ACRDHK_02880 [Actinomycetota bacterium]
MAYETAREAPDLVASVGMAEIYSDTRNTHIDPHEAVVGAREGKIPTRRNSGSSVVGLNTSASVIGMFFRGRT